MGYCIDVEVGIAIKDVKGALKAINALHQPELLEKNAGGGSSNGEKWYSWVKNPPAGGFETIAEAISAWRYEGTLQKDGTFEIEYFNGEKLGDDEQLFSAIAKFCDGSVSFRGEDGAQWRYILTFGKKMKEEVGTTVWG